MFYLCGLNYHKKGDYVTSLRTLKILEREMKSLIDIPHATAASIYGLMGSNCMKLGDNDSALQYHEKSLNMRLNIYGNTEHTHKAASYGEMSMV